MGVRLWYLDINQGMPYVFIMARKPRIHLPGGFYHVMLRGNGGQDIFFTDEDRYHLYDLIQEGIERFGHRIHAYCLMSNHLHLAVQIADTPLAKIMQNLSFRYTHRINKTQGRTGHLFQGRYKAILIDADTYLLELVRYIHLNPVRALMVEVPDRYPWSGHRAYLGEEEVTWLSIDWVLGHFGQRRSLSRQRYARFVGEGMQEGHREDFHQGASDPRVLGDDQYAEHIHDKLGDIIAHAPALSEIIMGVTDSYEISETELSAPGRRRELAEARSVVAYLAVSTGSATLTEVARCFGRDVATLSTGTRRVSIGIRSGKISSRAQKVLMAFGAAE